MLNGDESFTLDSEEIILVGRKNTARNKLVFAVCLKFFQTKGRYPTSKDIIDQLMLDSLSVQLNIVDISFDNYDWNNRTVKRFKQEIRSLLGYKIATATDGNKLTEWLIENILPEAPRLLQVEEYAYQFLHKQRLELLKSSQLERYIKKACYQFEQKVFTDIFAGLSTTTIKLIDELLKDEIDEINEDNLAVRVTNGLKRLEQVRLIHLKSSIAGAKLKNVNFELDKIRYLKRLDLPVSLKSLSRKLKQKYYLRIFASIPSDIKKQSSKILYASMAIFCHFRAELLTDDLVETLLQLIHKIRTSAEISIGKGILSEVKCVNGKFDILYTLANTAADNPEGIIKDTIYPKVSKEKLKHLAIELMSSKGRWYEQQVQRKMTSCYSHSHRRVLLNLLQLFTFHTNNDECKSILQAIEFIIGNSNETKDKYYNDPKQVPALDAIESKWRSAVIMEEEDDDKNKKISKIHKINYEISILEKLRDFLSCKLIWVEGAYRFRNPEEDLPKDFNLRTEYYYQLLNLPQDPKVFIQKLKNELNEHLQQLNDSINDNKKVKIINKNKGQIKITPYDAKVPNTYLVSLQQAINKRWSTINLIDILKETDLRVNFSESFPTVSSRESINKVKWLKRLLLCLYAIGSNTGLKRISAANDDVSYSELRYIKRKYINVANVRQAIAQVINAIIEIRDPSIWGTATTGCACDSTKVSSWDQNLMTEWHTRYRGRGIMIYWHVDKNSAVIYSQLKTCSSSEVGAMIKGVLDHCSKMDMKQAYVDTHGQSTIGFGFSNLLGFDLLPRLKKINKQKLFYSSTKEKNSYKNLALILKASIDWDKIEKYYNNTVKHTVALKIGTVEPDVMIKHLSKDNVHSPIYQALSEIGKVEKTIFLCRYLMFEELRIEIHEALNIVERMNSIMSFIFYGKLGEVSTNNKDEQELAIVCLHLLQVCMVYINTLIIQEVLSEQFWKSKLFTTENKKVLTPLIHSHINPYGLFPLDLNKRIAIESYKRAKEEI